MNPPNDLRASAKISGKYDCRVPSLREGFQKKL
jgi:hypothetical protein